MSIPGCGLERLRDIQVKYLPKKLIYPATKSVSRHKLNPTPLIILGESKVGTTSPEVNTFYQRLTEGFVEFIDQEAQLFVRSETPPEVSPSFVTIIMPTGRIACVWDQEDRAEWDIYVMNVDGSNQSRLTETGGAGLPAWSP